MPFNSDTYHANKAARDAAAAMAEARQLKAKIAAGERFYDWERPLEAIARAVAGYRLYSRLSRIYRDIGKRKRN